MNEKMKNNYTNWQGIGTDYKNNFGFVYKVSDPISGLFYIGRKNYWAYKTVKSRRHKRPENDINNKYFKDNFKESDWKTYKTSARNKDFKKLIKEKEDTLTWEVLVNCGTKGLLNYLENFIILKSSDFLLDPLCQNGHVGKIYKPSILIRETLKDNCMELDK